MLPEKLPNSDRSCEFLKARLRPLPPLPVPNDLEARLLAAAPPAMPHRAWTSRYWRLAVWSGVAVALTAACLLVMLRRAETGSRITAPSLVMIPKGSESIHPVMAYQ